VATDKRITIVESTVPKTVVHNIRRGETLSAIADKYGVGLAELKRANNLKSSNIRAGKTLKIPAIGTEARNIERTEYVALPMLQDSLYYFYDFDIPTQKIYVIPTRSDEHVLSGIVLENTAAGIQYHNIGVNGAKLSDYCKYPLFFRQLKALQPDLVVISLGTNESFDKLPVENYILQLTMFISSVRQHNPKAAILVATPPPSLFQRRYPNTFVAEYASQITAQSNQLSYGVWDLYSLLGGNAGIATAAKSGLIGSDRVHYSKEGYEMQGDLLSKAILQGLSEYQKQP
jgi:lysophospholipase L1-like esterase